MKVTLTDKGLQALAQNQAVQLLDFIVSDSRSLSAMEHYVAGQSVGSNTFYQYGIEENHTYIKGDTYTPSDGSKPYKVENTFLELIGTLNCLDVPSSFTMRSMGIKAKIGNNSPFVYAFGSISSSDKPYPVNSGELISYITPVKIIYDNAPDVTTEESGVPWKNFIQHTDTSVNSQEGAHGLKINPNTKEMTVGGVTISLSGGSERIDELERQVQGVLKYRASAGAREYNSEWVRRISGSGTVGDPWRIYTPYDLNLIRTAEFNQGQGYFSLENNIDLGPAIGIRATVTSEGYTVETLNSDAPLFNHGFGWEPLRLYAGHFEGNHHWIKGLFLGPVDVANFSTYYPTVPFGMSKEDFLKRRGGLFLQLANYSTINGLNMEESVILGGNSGYDSYFGSFCAYVDERCSITNCCSYADIVDTLPDRWVCVGGICGCFEGGAGTIAYNAFHGTLNKFEGHMAQGIVSGIGGYSPYYWNGIGNSYGNYTDVEIKFGNNRGGIHAAVNFYDSPWLSDYFIGKIYSRPGYNDDPGAMGTINSGRGGKKRLQAMQRVRFCYSLEGSAPVICLQGTVLTEAYMKSRDFVNLLNTSLPEARFVYHEGSFPRLDYEEENIPYTSPVASIDTSSNYVYDSGYTTQTLSSMASSSDVASMTASLNSDIQSKSIMKYADVTIRTTDWGHPGWDSKSYYWFNNLVDYNMYNYAVVIPQSGDVLDCGIYVDNIGFDNGDSHAAMPGYIEFKCSTTPQNDVTLRVIVVQNFLNV